MCTQNPFPRIQTDDPPGSRPSDPFDHRNQQRITPTQEYHLDRLAAMHAIDLAHVVRREFNGEPEELTERAAGWLITNFATVLEEHVRAAYPAGVIVDAHRIVELNHRIAELERRIVELEAAIRTLHMRASCWMTHDRVEIRAAGRSVRGVTAEVLSA